MAESIELLCESCQYENVTKSSSQWCTDCEEGFCNECCRSHKAAKNSRNHHIIPTVEYLKTKQFKVNLQCTDHSKQLDFYCPIHDSVVCVECVQLHHSSCKDLRPLAEAAKGAKTSTAITDLEQTIDGLLENIAMGAQHLQQNETIFRQDENVAKKFIATKRAELNKHLDCLEEKMLQELKSKSERAMQEISLVTTKLETKRKNISDLKDTAKNMIQCLSNVQVFVAIRSILKTVVNEKNKIKPLLSSIPQINVAVQINPKFETFTDAFDYLGEIQITSEEAVVPYIERQLIQAQYQRSAEPQVHEINNIQLKLRTKITIGKTNSCVTGCLILPNKCIMIASYSCVNASYINPSLTILKEDGSHDHEIRVAYDPYYLTIIDDERVAFSDLYDIYTTNLNTRYTSRTLKALFKYSIRSITFKDNKLYALTRGGGIKVLDTDLNTITTIPIYNDDGDIWTVTARGNQIYFAVRDGSVYCVNIDGTQIWTCQDDRLQCLDYTSPAIAVDNYGITFAAGYKNNILLAISTDGKQQKVLLTSSDGLHNPSAVYYDEDSKRLLVCNKENGNCALYDVIY